MAKCVVCGKNVLLTTHFGNSILCKNCASMINVSLWSNRDFLSNEDLVEQKNSVLQLATSNGFPSFFVNNIAEYFDEYIKYGYITTINGKAGQKLKVFADFCIVDTKNETKKTELSNMFYQFVDDDTDDDESLISTDQKKNLVNGLMSGRLLQTGVGMVASAVIDSKEKEKVAEKKSKEKHRKAEQLISVGEYKINLRDISKVDTYSALNTANGYLRFIPKGVSTKDYYSCQYFFFSNSIPFESKKIKQRAESIRNMLNERILLLTAEGEKIAMSLAQKSQERNTMTSAQSDKKDSFEDIRKFKKLFDEGIITEDEFNKKKKELLGL